MKLKMKSTRYGSADGVQIDEYKKGETYEVRDSLAAIFLKEGWAVKVDKASHRKKDAGAAPENKSAPSIRRRA
ncbi:MAG: hypothetical protein OEZ51_07105 [Nitrospinota bacterium]|nr:hypothetical protein [Nitrospinota bacterium]